ncbi:hypothetical protein AB0J35_59195 [Nonomuraea angiospora]|uniref:hypothetical protein n=1 Tax=Nonomuraea angiospora TaxID=46172 RepID=UPI00343E801F
MAGEYEFTASYDAAGNLIRQGMPGKGDLASETLTFGYTDLGLAKDLTSDYGGGTTYVKETVFSATARLNERSYGANSQVKRTYTWDEGTGWLSRLTTTSGSQIAQDDTFTYNKGGQLTRIQDTPAGQYECFGYDGLDRLTTAFTTAASWARPGGAPDRYQPRAGSPTPWRPRSGTPGAPTHPEFSYAPRSDSPAPSARSAP